jgi:hypothetical protein
LARASSQLNAQIEAEQLKSQAHQNELAAVTQKYTEVVREGSLSQKLPAESYGTLYSLVGYPYYTENRLKNEVSGLTTQLARTSMLQAAAEAEIEKITSAHSNQLAEVRAAYDVAFDAMRSENQQRVEEVCVNLFAANIALDKGH